jgi:hypothetical protein
MLRTDPSGNGFFTGLSGFPENSYILRTNSTLQYKDGTPAGVDNGVHNHTCYDI